MKAPVTLARAAFVATALSLLFSIGVRAEEPLTPLATVEKLADLKQYYQVPDFKIGGKYNLDDPDSFALGGEGGVTLESLGAEPLQTSYIAMGTPEHNEDGEIINAVIISSYYSGDATNMYNFWVEGQPGNGFCKGPVIGKGLLIDTDKYYVVMMDALGLWGTSKPSLGLGLKFPQYSYMDLVQANYRMLRDHLKIAKVKLATGVSMGATQTYVWGIMHPEFVEAIMPLAGTTQSDGGDPVGKWTFQLATAAIKSDPVWHATKGDYYDKPKSEHPNKGVEFMWSMLSHTGFDLAYRSEQPWKDVEGDVFYWEPKGKESSKLAGLAAKFDAIDLLYRNAAGDTHNINDQLERIKSRVLIGHVRNDLWLNYQLAEAAAARIPGAQLIMIESPLAHYAAFQFTNLEQERTQAFIDGKAMAASQPDAAAPAAKKAGGAFSK